MIAQRVESVFYTLDLCAQAVGAMIGAAMALFLLGLLALAFWRDILRPCAVEALDFLLSVPRRIARRIHPKGKP